MLQNQNTNQGGNTDWEKRAKDAEERWKKLGGMFKETEESFESLSSSYFSNTSKMLTYVPVFGKALSEMSDGFKKSYSDMAAGATMLMRTMGANRSRISEFERAVSEAIPEVMKVGGQAKDAVTIMEDIAKATRVNVAASSKDVAEIYSVSQLLGQTSKTIVDNFVNVGVGMKDIGEETQKSIQYVRSLGVNTKQVMDAVLTNIEKVNSFNFEGGVQGLTKMATQATMLRFDMNETFTLAEKVMNPEQAVATAAAFQRLGVMAGDLVDPFALMNKSINDPQGLQNSLIDVAKQFAYFDEETKSFRISPQGMLTLREMGQQTGVSAREMSRAALAAAELDQKLSEISPDIDIPEDDKIYLSNIAKMGEGGQYEVAIKDESGKEQMKALSELSRDEITKLIERQKEENKPIEQIQREQLTALKAIESQLEGVKEALKMGMVSTKYTTDKVEEFARVSRNIVDSAAKVMPNTKETRNFLTSINFDDLKQILSSPDKDTLQILYDKVGTALSGKVDKSLNTITQDIEQRLQEAKRLQANNADNSIEVEAYSTLLKLLKEFKPSTTEGTTNNRQNVNENNTQSTEQTTRGSIIPSGIDNSINQVNQTLKTELKVQGVSDIKNLLTTQSQKQTTDEVVVYDENLQNHVSKISENVGKLATQQAIIPKPIVPQVQINNQPNPTEQLLTQELKVQDSKLIDQMDKFISSTSNLSKQQIPQTIQTQTEQSKENVVQNQTLTPNLDERVVKVEISDLNTLTNSLKNIKVENINVEVPGLTETKDIASSILNEIQKPNTKIEIEGLKETLSTLTPTDIKPELRSLTDLMTSLPDRINKETKITGLEVLTEGMKPIDTRPNLDQINQSLVSMSDKIQKEVKITGLENIEDLKPIDNRTELKTINDTLALLPTQMNKNVEITGLETLTESLKPIDNRTELKTINDTLALLPTQMNNNVEITGLETLTESMKPIDTRPNLIDIRETLATLPEKMQKDINIVGMDKLTENLKPTDNTLKLDEINQTLTSLPEKMKQSFKLEGIEELRETLTSFNIKETPLTNLSFDSTNNILTGILDETKKQTKIEGVDTIINLVRNLKGDSVDIGKVLTQMELPVREIYEKNNTIENNVTKETVNMDYDKLMNSFNESVGQIVNLVQNRNLDRIETPTGVVREETINTINKNTREVQEVIMGGTSTIVFKVDTTSAPNVNPDQVKQMIDKYLNQTNFKEYIASITKDKDNFKTPVNREYSIRG